MRAAILAGGRGTRLAPYTTVLPKPLMPVGERPILELILHQLRAAGITTVDLCVGHLGELIQAYFTESGTCPDGLDLRYHFEDEPLGTAGAVRYLGPLEGPMLVMNGDILTTLDYADLVDFHLRNDAALTVASKCKEVSIDLGVIEGDGVDVTDYIEKPNLGYEVSMGIYVYSPKSLEHVPGGQFDFPELVLALLNAGERVCKYRFEGPWYDIGTVGELELATEAYTADRGLFDRA
jgi:NDP-sugar pyrophosphorylase family protein